MDNMDFSKRIIELRKEKGLSQKELGDMLGVSNKAVSKWENGESMPKTSTMLKLAEMLDIDGNDLIGFESKEAYTPKFDTIEIEKLKSENAILSSKLNAIDKRRKRTLIFVVVICIISVVASGIIAVFLSTDSSINTKITDAGKEGTKIIFAGKEFVAPNDFSEHFLGCYEDNNEGLYFYTEKNATYINADGKEQKAVIECDDTESFVKLTIKGRNYHYVNKQLGPEVVSIDNIECFDLIKSTIAGGDYDEFYDYDITDTYYKYTNNKEARAFCDFYQKLNKPVDKKITQRFLGNNARTLKVSFDSDFCVNYQIYYFELGEFFKDSKGNVYFYDYITTNSYSVGEELTNYVY